ncbi:MAG: hypothetical protein WKF73_07755 [Nocardioidaceae bacterium]
MPNAARPAVLRLCAAAESDDLDELCARAGVQLLVLFGSARSVDSYPDDVDLAVRFERDASHDVLGLLDHLYRLTGYEDFDVLDLGRAGPLARERALVGARVLHEANPGRFANEQIAAIMERIDTDEMRRAELALMAR